MVCKEVIVPDYYKDFKCKCGACRTCCCAGWCITVSYREYCKLIGLECGAELRHRLDCAFHILKDADEARYAAIKPNYMGNCYMLDKDGLCLLQKERGESVLPLVCKTYPRSIIFDGLPEACCTNSCEGVLELMFNRKDKLKFTTETIESYAYKDMAQSQKRDLELQLKSIEILQDRSLSFAERIARLGDYAESCCGGERENGAKTDTMAAMDCLITLEKAFDDYSRNFRLYSDYAEVVLGLTEEDCTAAAGTAAAYSEARGRALEALPDMELYFEHIMVNHLIYERFPYSASHDTMWDEYLEFCGVYALTRFVATLYVSDKTGLDCFTDCIASLFKCFEHSDANAVIKKILKENKFDGKAALALLAAAV